MIKKFIKTIKKNIGTRIEINPIINPIQYKDNKNSFTGNSLQSDNVLIIGNVTPIIKAAIQAYNHESCYATYINKKLTELNFSEIEEAGKREIGYFDHIINIITVDNNSDLFINDCYNTKDIEYITFEWLQVEVDYLVKNCKNSTLHLVFILDYSNNIEIMAYSLRQMINGLGKLLLNHNITLNGIIADKNIPEESIIQSLLFCSSKYGQVLAGETINLKYNGKFSN